MQLKAVTHGTDGGPKHPLLILAGAGSGKTRVITTKIAHLIAEKRAEPESILAVTFTNKAAEEMRQRAAALAPGASAVLIRTFHSFGAWLLRRNAKTAGLDRSFVIYDEDDSVALLKAMTEGAGRKGGGLETGGARSANARFKRLSFLISRAKDYALSPEDDLSAITPDPEFPALYRQYQDRLSGTGNADFGDLIFGALKLLRNEAAVRKRICQRFSVVLVDEFQDSNVAQFELLKQLFDTGTYLCVVGDDDQSIYRFRGAEVKNIIGFSRHFPDTDIIRLEENYRSTPPILSLASGVVSNNRGRLGKTLWTGKTGGIKPVLVYLRDHREEAAFCAELLAGGNRGGTAILYRVNAQSREFEHCFSRNHIPYRLVGSVSFYSREEVKDTLAALSLLVNPRDEVGFRRIINKPARGLGNAALAKIMSRRVETGLDFIEALARAIPSLSGSAKKGASVFSDAFSHCAEFMKEAPVFSLVEEVISSFGLKQFYTEEDAVSGTARMKNLEEVVTAASDYGKGLEGLLQFLEDLELDRSRIEGQEEGTEDRVTLITLHNTKGLEFDRVIITGMEEGLFPSLRGSENDEDDLEEERRLFYVGITRAREELYLTTCGMRQIWGRTMPAAPSRFLSEFPKNLVTEKATYSRTEEGGFPPGMEVDHPEYGRGLVAGQRVSGSQVIITVAFEDGRVCQFIPKYSSLRPVG